MPVGEGESGILEKPYYTLKVLGILVCTPLLGGKTRRQGVEENIVIKLGIHWLLWSWKTWSRNK